MLFLLSNPKAVVALPLANYPRLDARRAHSQEPGAYHTHRATN